MFRIALCDDDVIIHEQIKAQLDTFPEPVELLVNTFSDGAELGQALWAGDRYDLIILDIEMDRMDGVQVGTLLREELKDRYTPILYISGRQSHAMELFDTQPLNFLVKPIQQEKLHQCLRMSLSQFNAKKVCLELTEDKIRHRIPCCTIRYLESRNKQVAVHALRRNYVCYEKLTDILDRLPQEFLHIHKSFIVNHNFITNYRMESVTLDDGTTLSISRNSRKRVQQKMMDLASTIRKG